MAPGHTIALFFDVSKAYERMNPALILTKLIDAEAPPWIIHFISQFCSNRTFQIRHREILSAKHSPLFSIPQSSPLSPLLFKLFFDPPDVDEESQDLLFVDDYAVTISDEDLGNLQKSSTKILNKMWELGQNNGIQFDASKPVAMATHYENIVTLRFGPEKF